MKRRFGLTLSLLISSWGITACADEAAHKQAFVEANVLAIFYHELGHAVIDLMQVPIFGQEEDAADVMSVLLIDLLFEEQDAQSIAYDSAFGFIDDPHGESEVAYWDLHGPDEQRYYNHVCLFYGANPDEREDLAEDLGLPEARAETCLEEYEIAADSWGWIFEDMRGLKDSAPIVFRSNGSEQTIAHRLLKDEVAFLNEDFRLPDQVSVSLEPCGEANAFYDPSDVSIVFCTEFIAHLEDLFDAHMRAE